MSYASVTWEDLGKMRRLLDSIDFLKDSEETCTGSSESVYARWDVKDSDVSIVMFNTCKIRAYRRGGEARRIINPMRGMRRSAQIKLPKTISLEEIISDESLDKKERAKLAWLLGEVSEHG